MDSLENQQAILNVIAEHKPDVVIIDPLDEFGWGDLNKDSDMRLTLVTLARICRKGDSERAIVVLHHALVGRGGAVKVTGYDRAAFARNSKALLAWTPAQINLAAADKENNDRIIVACGKNSNGPEFEPFAIRLNPATMIYECNPTLDVQRWAAEMEKPGGKKEKPIPSVDDFLALFSSNPVKPRECLFSGEELRVEFRKRRWDEVSAPSLRDKCEGLGRVSVFHGAKNQKLVGLPDMVKLWAEMQKEKGSVLEQVPLSTPTKKCRKRKK